MANRPHVAVLGAGTMGPGIAASFAAAGHPVRLWARRPAVLGPAGADARDRIDVLARNGLAGADPGPVDTVSELPAAVAGTAVVVEAVSEDPQAKNALLLKVERHVGDDALLASTTSGLDVDRLCEGAANPGRFVVTHFWNPAHLIPLVEVVGGARTAPGRLERACDLIRGLGKHPVLLRKFVPGFLGVRLQQAVVREAIALLESGVASAEDIDAATRLSFGARFPVIGPLETSDLGGLDVLAAIHEYLLADLDRSTAPQQPLVGRVADGHLGAKVGQGFYDWSRRSPEELIRRRDEELIARLKSLREAGDLPAVP